MPKCCEQRLRLSFMSKIFKSSITNNVKYFSFMLKHFVLIFSTKNLVTNLNYNYLSKRVYINMIKLFNFYFELKQLINNSNTPSSNVSVGTFDQNVKLTLTQGC